MITIGANSDEAKFRVYSSRNTLFEHHRTHIVTARLPGGCECSTELRIIDDDCKFLIYACTLQVITLLARLYVGLRCTLLLWNTLFLFMLNL